MMNNKPMKKFVNGVLNLNYIKQNRAQKPSRFLSNDASAIEDIKRRSEEKKINDSVLDKKEEKSQKELREEETRKKIDKAKELLGIKETKNKKSDKLDNYNPEYRRKHELRDFSSKEHENNNVNINYDDIFRDL